MTDILAVRKIDHERARAEAVIGILLDWAKWQQGYSVRLGYPPKSCGLQSGYVSASFDEMCDSADRQRNEIVDSCITDLPPAQNAAIYRRYLAAVFRMRDYEGALAQAHVTLSGAFVKKGVLW